MLLIFSFDFFNLSEQSGIFLKFEPRNRWLKVFWIDWPDVLKVLPCCMPSDPGLKIRISSPQNLNLSLHASSTRPLISPRAGKSIEENHPIEIEGERRIDRLGLLTKQYLTGISAKSTSPRFRTRRSRQHLRFQKSRFPGFGIVEKAVLGYGL